MIVELIFAALSITGAILNIKKNRWGFVIWTIGSVGWIVSNITYEMYGQIPLWIALIIFNIWGFIRWTNDDNHNKYGWKNLNS